MQFSKAGLAYGMRQLEHVSCGMYFFFYCDSVIAMVILMKSASGEEAEIDKDCCIIQDTSKEVNTGSRYMIRR